MISVISVDFHGGIFQRIQEDSVHSLADKNIPYSYNIYDNGNVKNIGHAKGVEELIKNAPYNLILLLDIDAHILTQDWNRKIIDLYEQKRADGVRLIAGEGGKLKPVRPCVMLFEKDYFLSNDMTFQSQNFMGAKFDVGVLFAFQVLSRGDKVELFKYAKKSYPDTIGNDYTLEVDGKQEPFVFHHWYGTRWYSGSGERVRDKVDSLTWEKFEASRSSLLSQYENKTNSKISI